MNTFSSNKTPRFEVGEGSVVGKSHKTEGDEDALKEKADALYRQIKDELTAPEISWHSYSLSVRELTRLLFHLKQCRSQESEGEE